MLHRSGHPSPAPSACSGRPGGGRLAARVGLMPQSTGAWSGIKAAELLQYLATLYAAAP